MSVYKEDETNNSIINGNNLKVFSDKLSLVMNPDIILFIDELRPVLSIDTLNSVIYDENGHNIF